MSLPAETTNCYEQKEGIANLVIRLSFLIPNNEQITNAPQMPYIIDSTFQTSIKLFVHWSNQTIAKVLLKESQRIRVNKSHASTETWSPFTNMV